MTTLRAHELLISFGQFQCAFWLGWALAKGEPLIGAFGLFLAASLSLSLLNGFFSPLDRRPPHD
jgi:hypothetical protein